MVIVRCTVFLWFCLFSDTAIERVWFWSQIELPYLIWGFIKLFMFNKRSLAGYSPLGSKELDMTEVT